MISKGCLVRTKCKKPTYMDQEAPIYLTISDVYDEGEGSLVIDLLLRSGIQTTFYAHNLEVISKG